MGGLAWRKVGRIFLGGAAVEVQALTTLGGTSWSRSAQKMGMENSRSRFRRPSLDEQQVLDQLEVRLVASGEQERFDALLIAHHYLHSASAVGEQMRDGATFKGQWLALALLAAPTLHLR